MITANSVAAVRKPSPLQAVHDHCRWCCGGNAREVAQCTARHCLSRYLASAASVVWDVPFRKADFSEAVRRDPRLTVVAYFGRAIAYEATGQAELAKADIGGAIKRDQS